MNVGDRKNVPTKTKMTDVPCILTATARDLKEVLNWTRIDDLKDETSFHCNVTEIVDGYNEGHMKVLLVRRRAVAFFVSTRFGLLLVVRARYRGYGYGRKLATFIFNDSPPGSIIRFACSPSTSVPFWQCMGAYIHQHCFYSYYGFVVVPPLKHAIPDGATSSRAEICFYPEEALYKADIVPFYVAILRAVRTDPHTLLLEQRVSVFDVCDLKPLPVYDEYHLDDHAIAPPFVYGSNYTKDVALSIEVDGLVVLPKTKAKYIESAMAGVCIGRRDHQYAYFGSFYIDKIILSF